MCELPSGVEQGDYSMGRETEDVQAKRTTPYQLFPDIEPSGSLDEPVKQIYFSKLKQVEKDTAQLHKEVRDIQKKSQFLSRFKAMFQSAANEEGEVELSKIPRIEELLKEAEELGVAFSDFGLDFSKIEKMTFQQVSAASEAIRTRLDDLRITMEIKMQGLYKVQTALQELSQWLIAHAKALSHMMKAVLRNLK